MSTKKNFAAAAFLSTAGQKEAPAKKSEEPSAETKTRRLQLLLKPSDYEKLRRMADQQQCSVNRMIELLIAGREE